MNLMLPPHPEWSPEGQPSSFCIWHSLLVLKMRLPHCCLCVGGCVCVRVRVCGMFGSVWMCVVHICACISVCVYVCGDVYVCVVCLYVCVL